jgi:hypothetical protein
MTAHDRTRLIGRLGCCGVEPSSIRHNELRSVLNAGRPTVGICVHSTWPSVVEAIGHTGMFDYAEFLAEYAPFDLYALDSFRRAVEL